MLLDTYLPIAIFALIALGGMVAAFWVSRFFRPTRVTALKRETYECGEVPIGEAQVQFHFQFYMFAIIFVVFDVVTIFLMIWALNFTILSDDAKILVLAFFGLLLVGVFYALKKEERLWI
jgi:NADH:ubiquinone oxidoreductase subunit 3 (subunit A)